MLVLHGWNAAAVFWVAIVAVVFISSFFRYRERTSRHRMIETLAEKGQPIPPDDFGYERYYGRHYWRYRSPIASGILLMCVGVALAVFLWGMTGGGNPFAWDTGGDGHPPSWLPFVGVFPFMVGFARLLAGIFDRPQPPRNDS
jgi:hypothetical protein